MEVPFFTQFYHRTCCRGSVWTFPGQGKDVAPVVAGCLFRWELEQASAATKLLQSCPTLCDPTGSAVPGILQARTLEWVAISFSNVRTREWA